VPAVKGLDHEPSPVAAFRLPRRAPPPLGYFAETSHAASVRSNLA